MKTIKLLSLLLLTCFTAHVASAFRRLTKAFQDIVAAGGEGLRILKVDGTSPIEGGVPLVVDALK